MALQKQPIFLLNRQLSGKPVTPLYLKSSLDRDLSEDAIENKFTRMRAHFTLGKKLCPLFTDFSADARSEI